jgi:3-phenylpropionate/trans-cinnamate dioxygenase ferredoxin reductase component
MTAGTLIVGGGLAAQRCAETLRRCGDDAAIRMMCAEPQLPYDRPPLSKAVLAGPDADMGLTFREPGWYADHAIDLMCGVTATGLDPTGRSVRLGDGSRVEYERLLVATGSRPRRLAELDGFSNVSTLRTLDDARRLRDALTPGGRLVVVGAGFIGQEVAAAATKAGMHVTIVEAAAAPLDALLGASVGAWFTGLHEAHGVDVLTHARIVSAEGTDRVDALALADGRRLECDHVVVGIGVEPDVAWMGPEHAGGVRADTHGATALPGVFAAGDAAATYEPVLGRHVAGGHWESAARQGASAARSMLGLDPRVAPPASFWTDVYDTRVQYLGHATLADATSLDGDPTARDFVVTFTRSDRPVAFLLVGRPAALPSARAALAA